MLFDFNVCSKLYFPVSTEYFCKNLHEEKVTKHFLTAIWLPYGHSLRVHENSKNALVLGEKAKIISTASHERLQAPNLCLNLKHEIGLLINITVRC